MAMSTSTMRAHLGSVTVFAPSRPPLRRARTVAPVRAEKSLGDKIQEKTEVCFPCMSLVCRRGPLTFVSNTLSSSDAVHRVAGMSVAQD